jgi:hypothetical protein
VSNCEWALRRPACLIKLARAKFKEARFLIPQFLSSWGPFFLTAKDRYTSRKGNTVIHMEALIEKRKAGSWGFVARDRSGDAVLAGADNMHFCP